MWKNCKYATKKIWSKNKQNYTATGGGPSTEVPLSPLEERIATILCYQQQDEDHFGDHYGVENIDPNARNVSNLNDGIESDIYEQQPYYCWSLHRRLI